MNISHQLLANVGQLDTVDMSVRWASQESVRSKTDLWDNQRINRPLEMTSDARRKCRNLHYAITYSVIWANQKTESLKYHWLRALAMFDVTSFPASL